MDEVQQNATPAAAGREMELRQLSQEEMRAARTDMVEMLAMRFTNLFTAIVGNCDMALAELTQEHPSVMYLLAAKRATFQANDVNDRLKAIVQECREASL